MQIEIYSILDSKQGSFMRPFFSINNGTAIRSMIGQLKTDQELRHLAPDMSLYHIATFDDKTGVITPKNPESITSLSALILQPDKPQQTLQFQAPKSDE